MGLYTFQSEVSDWVLKPVNYISCQAYYYVKSTGDIRFIGGLG